MVMELVVRRTLRRRLPRQGLWHANVEPFLWTIFTDPEHIARWAWSTHSKSAGKVSALQEQRPDADVVRLKTRLAVEDWMNGALREIRRRS